MKPQDVKKLVYWYKYIFKKLIELRILVQNSIDEINKEWGIDLKIQAQDSEYVVDQNNKSQKTSNFNPLDSKNS